MESSISLPLTFLRFWYLEAPVGILKFWGKLNAAFFELFSLPLLLKTFFQPLKNEYRQGLVGFSIGMGIVVKSVLILFNFILLIPLVLIEMALLVLFVAFPIVTVWLLFL